jgi:hypothetical protein
MKQIRNWILNHENIVVCIILFVMVFLIRGQSISSSPGLIVILSFLALPTIFGICRGYASIFGKVFKLATTQSRGRIILLTIPLLFLSLGIFAFIFVVALEFYGQLTCKNCAQGGMGVFLFLPVAWLSYALVLFTNGCFIDYHVWPNSLTPDFSFKKKAELLKNKNT